MKNLKLLLLFTCLFILFFEFAKAQSGAAINTSGSAAHPSSILDISSVDKGILIPRITESQKQGILAPANGLMIYQTDGASGFWYFDGSIWRQSIGAPGATGPVGPTGADGVSGFLLPGTDAGLVPYWNGVQWVLDTSNIYNIGNSVGVGTKSPHSSAAFEVSSSNKGTLITRLSTTERNLIISPAEGLQIFNTTTKCFEYFAYGIWQTGNCAVCPYPGAAASITGTASVCLGQNSVIYSVPQILNAANYIWSYSGIGATINGNSESITVDFDINATQGVLSVKGNNYCGDGDVSPDFAISVGSVPSAPVEGIHSLAKYQIVWNWNSVPDASGYKYNIVNDYGSATDIGTALSFTQLGLNCESPYNLYIWAYNYCGVSQVVELSANTIDCWICGDNVSVIHIAGSVSPVNKNTSYGTVSSALSGSSKCWINKNLGAAVQPASSADDTEAAAGWYWQFNRTQGYMHTGSVRTPSTAWTGTITENFDWLPANDPCAILLGSGWRIPTSTELNNVYSNGGWGNYNNAFASVLKMHAAGYIDGGSLRYRNEGGTSVFLYSSSSQDSGNNTNRFAVYANTSSIVVNAHRKSVGMTLRCLKD